MIKWIKNLYRRFKGKPKLPNGLAWLEEINENQRAYLFSRMDEAHGSSFDIMYQSQHRDLQEYEMKPLLISLMHFPTEKPKIRYITQPEDKRND